MICLKSDAGCLPAFIPDRLFQEGNSLVSGGSDTTSTNFYSTIFFLSITKPARLFSAHSRDSHDLPNCGRNPRGNQALDLLHCACIDEPRRTSSPVPADPAREVLPGGMVVDGILVPEGTQIATGIYSLHHNESVFPDPFIYRPKGWIVDGESGVSAFSPFFTGVRACVGKNLAYLEISITMARLLFPPEVKAIDGNTLDQGTPDLMRSRRNKNQFQVTDVFIAAKQGPITQFNTR